MELINVTKHIQLGIYFLSLLVVLSRLLKAVVPLPMTS